MKLTPIAPADYAYAHGCLVEGASRLLFVSGQIPDDEAGKTPADFSDQARLVWRNIEARLAEAGMSLDNLVKFTVFLSDRKWRAANYEVRQAVLGNRKPAMTIIVCDIYDEKWLLEIEAVAAG